ncbi:hypothetical protein [Enterococcus sp. AZ180]|uniref:hypothetical protein n=1 Tax=Enterococcus sp. AZ180 TaxID=2774961 RepID=UPI003F22EF88
MLNINQRASVATLKEHVSNEDLMWNVLAKVIHNDEELEKILKTLQSEKYVKYSTRTLHVLDGDKFRDAAFATLPAEYLSHVRVIFLDPEEWAEIDVFSVKGFSKLSDDELEDLGVERKIVQNGIMDFENLYGAVAGKLSEVGFEVVGEGYFFNKYLK